MNENDLYDSIATASALDRGALPVLLAAWARLCMARGVRSLTAHEVVAYAYRCDVAETGALRATLEHFAGSPVDPRRLGLALCHRIKGAPVRVGDPGGLVRLVVDGRSGGRTRWRVETVEKARGELRPAP